MHMICTSMPIPASTELTEFLHISCRKVLPHPVFGSSHPVLAPGDTCPLPPTGRYFILMKITRLLNVSAGFCHWLPQPHNA